MTLTTFPVSLAALSLDMIPPDIWTALISAGLTLAVSAAHARGRKLPLIEWLLDAVLATDAKTPTPDHLPILNEILTELRALHSARQGGNAAVAKDG